MGKRRRGKGKGVGGKRKKKQVHEDGEFNPDAQGLLCNSRLNYQNNTNIPIKQRLSITVGILTYLH